MLRDTRALYRYCSGLFTVVVVVVPRPQQRTQVAFVESPSCITASSSSSESFPPSLSPDSCRRPCLSTPPISRAIASLRGPTVQLLSLLATFVHGPAPTPAPSPKLNLTRRTSCEGPSGRNLPIFLPCNPISHTTKKEQTRTEHSLFILQEFNTHHFNSLESRQPSKSINRV